MIEIGENAPDFSAKAYENGAFIDVSLKDYRGKWVYLFFYPGDFTFVCVTELIAIAARIEEFKKLNVQVLGISTDSVYVHKMWEEQELSKVTKQHVPFPMLADSCARIGQSYGVFSVKHDVNLRGSFIIDPEGVVQSIEIIGPSVGRDFDEALRQLNAHIHVDSSNGCDVIPTGWKPGEQVLKPTPELVGKVWETWTPQFYYRSSK